MSHFHDTEGVEYPYLGTLRSAPLPHVSHRGRYQMSVDGKATWITACGMPFTDSRDWDSTSTGNTPDGNEIGDPTCFRCQMEMGYPDAVQSAKNAQQKAAENAGAVLGTGRVPRRGDPRVKSYAVVTSVPNAPDTGNLALELDLYYQKPGVNYGTEEYVSIIDHIGNGAMQLRAPVFYAGEIMLLNEHGREIGYPGRKPSKWDIAYETFATLSEALDRYTEWKAGLGN